MSNTVEHLRIRVRERNALPGPAARRAIRTASAVTLAEIAEAVGVSREAIRLYEKGARFPREDTLGRYAAVLAALQEELSAGARSTR